MTDITELLETAGLTGRGGAARYCQDAGSRAES